jgi:uncharacterized membrane protein
MEVLAVLLFLIILIIVITLKNTVTETTGRLLREISQLKEELQKIRAVTSASTQQKIEPQIQDPATTPVLENPSRETPPWESGFKRVLSEEELKEKQPVKQEWLRLKEVEEKEKQEKIKAASLVTAAKPVPANTPIQSPPPPKPGFFEKHPDLEKFIGENLVNKIGIAILVLAIGFFVKYAIDKNWIGEIGRVGIGMVCGGILTGLAHRLRTNYKAFSSVLVGGGLAVFYFTIALAYHQFHLFGQVPAFIIMIIITAFAVALALLYNRQELAVIALIGGFITPFLVSTGNDNYKTLFIYLLVLNTGLLIIAYNKAWRLLNILAFSFTSLLFVLWVVRSSTGSAIASFTPVKYSNGLVFATAFYLLFFSINVANNIKEQKKFIASDFTILLLNTALYFTLGLYFLTQLQASAYRGLFCVAIGLFNLVASYFLFRKQKVDTNILYLLIGITLTFISLAAPVQLHGNHITLFWASEAVMLYWLYQRSKISIIYWASLLVWACMLVSLLMDWITIYSYSSNALPVITNRGFVTGFVAAIASYGLFLLNRKTAKQPLSLLPINTFRVAGVVLLFFSGAFEINHQFQYYYPSTGINLLYILLYTVAFLLLLLALTHRVRALSISWPIQVSLLSVSAILYLVAIPDTFLLLRTLLQTQKNIHHFAAHWVGAILMAIVCFWLIRLIQKNIVHPATKQLLSWILVAWIVVFLSVEINLLSNAIFFTNSASWQPLNDVYLRTGLPILWGLCSFACMWLGMRYKFRPLRIVSLTLFSITLLKLFIFDIRDIPVGGKIAAFFCLGVLLLIVSFMYQRLKRIIIEEDATSA